MDLRYQAGSPSRWGNQAGSRGRETGIKQERERAKNERLRRPRERWKNNEKTTRKHPAGRHREPAEIRVNNCEKTVIKRIKNGYSRGGKNRLRTGKKQAMPAGAPMP